MEAPEVGQLRRIVRARKQRRLFVKKRDGRDRSDDKRETEEGGGSEPGRTE